MNKIVFVFLLVWMSVYYCVSAQKYVNPFFRTVPDTTLSYTIDSPIVIKSRGLSAQDFIDQMLNDTLFYKAFQQMKYYTFTAENEIFTYDKKNSIESRIFKRILHDNTGSAYKKRELIATDSGKVYKRNGKYRHYTVQMFNYIFENDYNSDFIDDEEDLPIASTQEGYKDKLKTLLFNPGRPIKGIPFISNKTAIFEPELSKYYDYTYFKGTYLGDVPIFTFVCKVKPEFTKRGNTMIKELTTIFDARNFTILGRYIDMRYKTPLFDFDVRMNIELNYVGEELLPVRITYDGNWNIPFKRKEAAAFTIKHMGYRK